MKYFYIPACILTVILGFSLWTGWYVEGRTEYWSALLEQADQAGREEDWEAARSQMEQIYADWQGSQTFFHIIMEHSELDEAEDLFSGAFAMCREEDDADFHQLLAQLLKQLELLSETQQTSVKNIL
ncbi:MAG: DUF4363 family protein [Oscillospiraceae bacterium]|nr:DUF4363 family protein [Oscillospiraceae bacterium]